MAIGGMIAQEVAKNDEIREEESDDDEFEEGNILDLSRESPSKSFQKLVRRSSIVAKHLRNRKNEKLKVEIAKWTPVVVEEYPRARKAFRRSGEFAQQKKENESKKNQIKDKPSNMQMSCSYLERLKQPKVTESLLPMEPVMCGIKYIKNRWKDEALYKNNDFAIKLNLPRS